MYISNQTNNLPQNVCVIIFRKSLPTSSRRRQGELINTIYALYGRHMAAAAGLEPATFLFP